MNENLRDAGLLLRADIACNNGCGCEEYDYCAADEWDAAAAAGFVEPRVTADRQEILERPALSAHFSVWMTYADALAARLADLEAREATLRAALAAFVPNGRWLSIGSINRGVPEGAAGDMARRVLAGGRSVRPA